MPVIRSTEGTEYDMHGATFTAFAGMDTGGGELRAWNCRLPAGQPGVEHRISREEVFLVRAGTPRIAVDGAGALLAAGDVVIAPAGCLLRVDNPGSQNADLWVTTSAGLSAQLADGSTLAPPWTR
jgi:mannose-6-phosphate isomerase-like protein (cupin superfamily)